MKEEKQMSFLDHLEELRWRLVRSAIAIVSIAVVIWIFQEWIIDNIFLSMKSPKFISFRILCDHFGMCIDEIPVKMQSTTMGGQFAYAMMMSMVGGVVLAFPYIFYQIWSFVKPGLKQNERKVVKGIVFYVSLLFFLGILFGYFVVSPMCVQFFGTYQISKSIDNIFTINSYMSTIISTVFYSGLLFLLPVVAYLFAKLGVISAAFLRKYRKHAIIGVLILSAVITPPDMISQIIVSIPIVLLYEISILVAAGVERNRKKEEIS
jgi:sec-independent protein translocase protein TatC